MKLRKGAIKSSEEIGENMEKKPKTKKATASKAPTKKKTTTKKAVNTPRNGTETPKKHGKNSQKALEKLSVEEIMDEIAGEELEDIQPEIAPTTSKEGLVPSSFFDGGLTPLVNNYMPEGVTLTKEEAQSVLQGVRRLSSGLRSSIPITCYGEKCPYAQEFPHLHKRKDIVGKPCPVEAMLVDMYTKRYIDEFDVISDSMSEVTTMTMLAATHIMEMRAFRVIAKDEGQGFIQNVVGFNNDEEPITQLQEHPAFNVIDRAWRWRKNLLESLSGTRRDKLKLAAASGGEISVSVSSAVADMRSTIEKLSIVDISDDRD